MKTSNHVRIVLWVTPEVKQLLTNSATKEDRVLTNWAIRTLRTAAGLPPNSATEPAEPLTPSTAVIALPVLPTSKPSLRGYTDFLAAGGTAAECHFRNGTGGVISTGEQLNPFA